MTDQKIAQKIAQNDKSAQVPHVVDPVPNVAISKEDKDAQDQLKRMVGGGYAVLLVLGIATGYLLSQSPTAIVATGKPGFVQTGKVAGITDAKTFKDSAVGTIQKGGLAGEGTHQLVRDGGPSQTVYLISSAVDLDQYVGKKVKVWGQTMAAKKAAWLMDVGKIELQ